MTYEGATLEVLNWDKYNPRTDSKKPSWFRLENNIATGPAFFGLDCEQKWLWVFILSLVSQNNGDPIVWNSAYCQQLTGIKQKKQDETLDIYVKFVRLRVSRKVTSQDSHVELEVTTACSPATRRTNETNETNNIVKFDFEILYQKYPRRLGKQKGFEKCKAQIKTEDDFNSLSTAIDRYKNYLRVQGTEPQFIKHFDTFMTTWRDWLDPGAGKVMGQSQPVQPLYRKTEPLEPVFTATEDPDKSMDRAEIRSIIGNIFPAMPKEGA